MPSFHRIERAINAITLYAVFSWLPSTATADVNTNSVLSKDSLSTGGYNNKIHNLDEFIVTGRKSPVKVASELPVQTISASSINTLGIPTVADAVKRFAGTNVKDYGGIGGLKTVSVRNMGASHTAVSYDGLPVTNTQGGQIDIGRFSLDNISSLSLAVGQSTDLLQPARLYSSAAILSINTVRPYFTDNRKASFSVGVEGGSFGYVSPKLRWWQRYGSKVFSSVNVSYLRADGNYPFRLKNGSLVTREHRTNTDVNSMHAEGNVYFDIDSVSKLDLKGYWYWSERGLPGGVILYNPVSTERLADRNAFVQAGYTRNFSEKWAIRASAKYSYGWTHDSEHSPKYPNGYYRDIFRQDEGFVSMAGRYKATDNLIVALATDGVINCFESTQESCPYPRRLTSVSALTLRWAQSRLTATATLVCTLTKEHVKSGETPPDHHRLSPTASVSWKVLPEQLLYIRGMYKSTFRLPTFNDMYYAQLGVRNLRPENADEFDIGITWSGAPTVWLDYMSVTVDGYYNRVTDKLVAFPSTFNWRMVNFGKVDIHGIDVTLAASFALPSDIHIVASGAYTLQKAINTSDPEAKDYKDQLPYTPVHSGNIGVAIETPWVNVGYTLTGVGKRYYLNQNIPANEIPGYTEQNITLSKKIIFGKSALSLKAEMINIGNVQYEVIRFYPMPGLSWRLGCEWTY